MKDFTSDVKKIPYSADRVFAKLSDLNNIGSIQDALPPDKVSDLTFDTDSCSFKVEKIGTISLRIVERDQGKTVKFVSEKSPVPFTLWIQLVEKASDDTRLKLTLRADIPFMLKGMVSKPLGDGIKKVADVFAALPY